MKGTLEFTEAEIKDLLAKAIGAVAGQNVQSANVGLEVRQTPNGPRVFAVATVGSQRS